MDVDQTVARREADEARMRARLSPPNAELKGRVLGLSGMKVFKAIFAGDLPPEPIDETLDFVPTHMEPGAAVFQDRPQRRHYNPLGMVHGGWFATLPNSAVGCAVHTTVSAGKGFTTLELKVNMVRPLNDRIALVRAEGKVYAHATTTCLIFDQPATTSGGSHGQA